MSDIRFNQWLHQSGTGGVTQVDGGHVGIGTTNPDVAVHTANNKKVNVGIVTANSVYAGNFYGSGANLTGITQTTINNNANNRLITGSGTANTLEGEATLTYTNSGSAGQLNLKRSTSTDQETIFYYGSSNLEIETREATGIKLKTNKSDRLIITSGGQIIINSSNAAEAQLDIYQSGQTSTSLSMLIGANEGGAGGQGRTNSNAKAARIGCPHYTNAEESLNIVTAYSGSSSNNLYWGGGTGVMNAATSHHFYTAANNTTTGGTERLRIDSSGNSIFKGSGTDVTIKPTDGLIDFGMDGRTSFVTGTNACYIYSGSGASGTIPAGTLVLQSRSNVNRDIVMVTGSTPTERLRIKSNGNIGLNNSSPAYLLDVTGASVIARFKSTNNNNVLALQGNNASHLAYMGTNSSGDFLVATGGSVTTRLNINTSGRVRLSGVPGVAGSNLTNVSIESDGNLCTQTSLREYKTNITSISDTSWLYNLNPVTFNWKKKTEVNGENVWEDTADDNGTQYGLIAEEVEAVKKEFCYYDNDNKLSGVHYDRLIAPLIKGLQEQKTEIDSLKARIATLEGS